MLSHFVHFIDCPNPSEIHSNRNQPTKPSDDMKLVNKSLANDSILPDTVILNEEFLFELPDYHKKSS